MTILETFFGSLLDNLIWRYTNYNFIKAETTKVGFNEALRAICLKWNRERMIITLPLCWLTSLLINLTFQRHRWPPNIWVHLLVLGFASQLVSLASGQCFGGVETYEKTSGTTVLCEGDCTSQGLLSQPDTSVTRDCIAICKQTSACSSFTVGKLVM